MWAMWVPNAESRPPSNSMSQWITARRAAIAAELPERDDGAIVHRDLREEGQPPLSGDELTIGPTGVDHPTLLIEAERLPPGPMSGPQRVAVVESGVNRRPRANATSATIW